MTQLPDKELQDNYSGHPSCGLDMGCLGAGYWQGKAGKAAVAVVVSGMGLPEASSLHMGYWQALH